MGGIQPHFVECDGSSIFASGQLHGYFDGEPPADFFKLLAFYITENTLASISWAISFE